MKWATPIATQHGCSISNEVLAKQSQSQPPQIQQEETASPGDRRAKKTRLLGKHSIRQSHGVPRAKRSCTLNLYACVCMCVSVCVCMCVCV